MRATAKVATYIESLSASCSKVRTVFEALVIPYLGSEIAMVDTFYCGAVSRSGAPEDQSRIQYLYLIFFFFFSFSTSLPRALQICL